MNRIYRFLLGILLVMVAAGALPAGLAMIIDPSGADTGMYVQILSGSPFRSFLIPGMVLFTINGLGSLTGAMLTFFRRDLAGYLGILFGPAFMIWIGFQVYWIGHFYLLAATRRLFQTTLSERFTRQGERNHCR